MILPKSTIGKKFGVAVTGLVLIGFIIAHLLGNLQIFAGRHVLNAYSSMLHGTPNFLWFVRIILLVSVLLHVVFTLQLARLNKLARPVDYQVFDPSRSTAASRAMLFGGLVIFFYVIYHILHMTTGTLHPTFDPYNVYGNLVSGLSDWNVAAFYIAANVALGFHLYHGVWSVFQTLGLNHPKYNTARRVLATVLSYGIAGGYILIPLAILFGYVK